VPKKISNKDQSIGRSRAKRSAAMSARRGIAPTSKPTKMQIDAEVKKQVAKSQKINRGGGGGGQAGGGGGGRNHNNDKAVPAKKKSHGAKLSGPEKAVARRVKQQLAKELKTAAVVKPAPKKAVKAATAAIQQKGIKVPEGKILVSGSLSAPLLTPLLRFVHLHRPRIIY